MCRPYRREPTGSSRGARRTAPPNAGHPTPLLLEPDGKLRRLDESDSPMIGAPRFGRREGSGRTEATVRCAAGSVLVLYTDGLTDITAEDLDERTELLERTVGGLAPGVTAEAVAEEVIRVCVPSRIRDDVALLAAGWPLSCGLRG